MVHYLCLLLFSFLSSSLYILMSSELLIGPLLHLRYLHMTTQWISLVQEQLKSRDQELHHWQDTLYSFVQALDQVSH